MPAELWELIKSYGLAAPLVGFALWWGFLERSDRKEAQADSRESRDALVKVLTDQLQVARERAVVDQTGNQVISALISKLAAKESS